MADSKKIQSFISLVSRKIEAFSQDKIISMIDSETLARIKAKDEHPFFQAYSICHDGVSNPTILGETASPITWTRRAVQSLKNVISKGIKFFNRHNKDNSTDNREALGEVVASEQMEIDGLLHHVVVGYFPDPKKVQTMDVCSHEGEWGLIETIGGYIADGIEKLTGIALSSSSIEQPAFSGARRLGMVQAFENNSEEIAEKITESKTMTFEEVKKAVNDLKIFPRQLFSIEDIKSDHEFGKVFEDLESKISEKDELIKTKDSELQEKSTAVKELTQKTLLSTADTRLEKMFDPLKLTDTQKTYLKKHFEVTSKKMTDEGLTDEGLKSFIDSQLEEYKINAEILGKAEDVVLNNDVNTTDEVDFTKTENNEFLNQDYEV